MRVVKIVAHELFDGENSFASAKLQVLSEPNLLAAGEDVAGFAGVKVHFVADAEQERLR